MNTQSLDQSIDVLSQALKQLAESKNTAGELTDITFIDFKSKNGSSNYGKGIIFSGQGSTKQIVLSQDPDRFFLTENLDLAKDKSLMINRTKVLDSKELGPTVIKSSLKEVGRLKGLIVDGSVSINQYVYFDSITDRFGIGTEQPNSALSISENGIEITIGIGDDGKPRIGTYASHDFNISTGSVPRIFLKANGDIDLGNFNSNPSQIRINGKLAINTKVPDPAVDLHVSGPVRIHNHLHTYAESAPTVGNYNVGDIVWNSNPRSGSYVGWVCTKAGSPGLWGRFGDIR